MKSRLTEALTLLVWLAILHVAPSTTLRLTIHFGRDRDDQNDITLTCSWAWAAEGDIINDAIFLRDGQRLNNEGTDEYKLTITQQTEGNFTCLAHHPNADSPVNSISARLQLAGGLISWE